MSSECSATASFRCGNGLGNALDFALSAQVSDQWQVFDDLFALKSRD